MGGYGEGFEQREGPKRENKKREPKKGRVGVRRDGEREKIEMKQIRRSGTRFKLSVALHFGVREFTVNHRAVVSQLCIISGSSYMVAAQSPQSVDTLTCFFF